MKSVFMGTSEEMRGAYRNLRDHMIRHYIRQYRNKKLSKKELAVIRKCLYPKNKFGLGM